MNLKVFLISFSFLFSGQPVGGVLAVVGSQIITQGDFLQQLDMAAKQEGINPQLTPKKYEALGDRVLSNIIDQYVLLDFAIKDSTIIVSDLEIFRCGRNLIDVYPHPSIIAPSSATKPIILSLSLGLGKSKASNNPRLRALDTMAL